jgi:UPF0755 protein
MENSFRLKKIAIKIAFLFLAGLFLFFLSYNKGIDKPLDLRGDKKVFVVPAGQGVSQVSCRLSEEKLIRSDFFFRLYCHWSGNDEKLQAGSYELSPAMSIKEIVAVLAAGKIISEETTITFIPGWTSRDIAQKIEEAGFSSKKNFYALS